MADQEKATDNTILDRLHIMLNYQKQIYAADNVLKTKTHNDRAHWFCGGIIMEASEVMDKTKFRHWKDEEEAPIAEVKKEIIDLIHYVLDLCIEFDMTAEEIYEVYVAKAQKNLKRFEIGKKAADKIDEQTNK